MSHLDLLDLQNRPLNMLETILTLLSKSLRRHTFLVELPCETVDSSRVSGFTPVFPNLWYFDAYCKVFLVQ